MWGSSRVIGRENFPVYAWRLNNDVEISEDEILLKVTHVLIESTSFSEMFIESRGDDNKIRETMMNIIEQRGKLQNPYTGTGGLMGGVVERIGSRCANTKGLKVGDEIIVLTTIGMFPLKLYSIDSIDYFYRNAQVKGNAVLYDGCPYVIKQKDTPWELSMLAFEESASVYDVCKVMQNKKSGLIIGSNIMVAALYGCALRKAIGAEGTIVGVFFEDELMHAIGINHEMVSSQLKDVFDEVYYKNVKDIFDVSDTVTCGGKRLFDISINCADQIGVEGASVLSTKEHGTVFYSSLSNNYAMGLFVQESINRDMNIISASGYTDGYYDFTIRLVKDNCGKMSELKQALESTARQRRVISNPAGITMEDESIKDMLHSNSRMMDSVIHETYKAACFDCPVIITGESGSGKEVLADLIIKMSSRKDRPCVKINCAAIPENLMESEFFGYESGAFTSASNTGKKGYFDMAEGGIIVLDEISEMPLAMQAKLLRVIQEGEYYRVGGETPVRVDVRIISLSNKNIAAMVRTGKFRDDLYYRLNVLMLEIPPLRKRKEDIKLLSDSILNKYNKKYGLNCTISNEGFFCLLGYEWPGNIRELDNVIHRAVIDSDQEVISSNVILKMLNEKRKLYNRAGLTNEGTTYAEKVNNFEKGIIIDALNEFGSARKAAEALGMTQSQMTRKKKKLDI
jgi:transcriptional regulator with PAS, ATPase and Fis domain